MVNEKLKDRLAAGLIRTGGLLVILVIVAIVVDVGRQAVPLFFPARVGEPEAFAVDEGALLAGTDARHEHLWVVHRDGTIRFAGGSQEAIPVTGGEAPLVAADHEIHGLISLLQGDGTIQVGRLRTRDTWDDGARTTRLVWRPETDPVDLGRPDLIGVTAAMDSAGSVLAAAWGPRDALLLHWDVDEEIWQTQELAVPGVVQVSVSEGLGRVAVVTGSGELTVLERAAGRLEPRRVEGLAGPVATARFIIGGATLVAAESSGAVRVLLPVPQVEVVNGGPTTIRVAGAVIAPGSRAVVADDQVGARFAGDDLVQVGRQPVQYRVVRSPPPVPDRPVAIAVEHRRRGFLVASADGSVGVYHATSGRALSRERWLGSRPLALVSAAKDDGAVVLAADRAIRRGVHNPHPEASLRTLFLPVWYEGYAGPAWVWQSTGGSDEFEPKLSLWPLLFGTLKATLYAMLVSLPLALLAAVYISQLAPPPLKAVVKPAVELMAGVPSVVVGFLAALWLAPLLERALFAWLLGAAALPLAVILALGLWSMLPRRLRRRLPAGSELAALLLGVLVVEGSVAAVAGPLEDILFDGSLQRFLFTELGVRYDQRNSLVVGVALGFAVIPVIFSIAEDACSAVPRSLVNGARALGATPWQAAVRLVVPAASPGLFAAAVLGLGRAVGETMIVLMATGNTPVLSASVFNGMRTMSAAIAVEIPEAPVGGTLFRVLFLTGALLFAFTLVLTTLADIVGTRLRRRYGRF